MEDARYDLAEAPYDNCKSGDETVQAAFYIYKTSYRSVLTSMADGQAWWLEADRLMLEAFISYALGKAQNAFSMRKLHKYVGPACR